MRQDYTTYWNDNNCNDHSLPGLCQVPAISTLPSTHPTSIPVKVKSP
eukprot:gene14423-30704_t